MMTNVGWSVWLILSVIILEYAFHRNTGFCRSGKKMSIALKMGYYMNVYELSTTYTVFSY